MVDYVSGMKQLKKDKKSKELDKKVKKRNKDQPDNQIIRVPRNMTTQQRIEYEAKLRKRGK